MKPTSGNHSKLEEVERRVCGNRGRKQNEIIEEMREEMKGDNEGNEKRYSCNGRK